MKDHLAGLMAKAEPVRGWKVCEILNKQSGTMLYLPVAIDDPRECVPPFLCFRTAVNWCCDHPRDGIE